MVGRGVGSGTEDRVAIEATGRLVGAPAAGQVEDVGGGLDPLDVDALEGGDILEDPAEVALQPVAGLALQAQPGEARHGVEIAGAQGRHESGEYPTLPPAFNGAARRSRLAAAAGVGYAEDFRGPDHLAEAMRPLARRILLTQGLIIVLVFGVSLFAFHSLREARRRAAHLRSEYDRGVAHEKLLAEVRDIARSRSFYVLEQRSSGPLIDEFRRPFYQSLGRIGVGVAGLERRAQRRPDLVPGVERLRAGSRALRRAAAEQELALALGDANRLLAAEAGFESAREHLWSQTLASKDESVRLVAAEIESLREAARQATALSLAFSALAVLVGAAASYSLTRSIQRPVGELRDATEALSRGQFDRRIAITRADELGDLGRAFNEMAARLQELDELKGNFVSVVSHELKTPLTSMRDAVDLLTEGVGGELSAKQRRLIEITRAGMDRLVGYAQEILDASRFEAGGVRLESEPLDLAPIVEAQVSMARPRAATAGIDLRWEPLDLDASAAERAALGTPITGDGFWLGRVVSNLLDNALKFTPTGGAVRVRCGFVRGMADDRVVLEVADSGIGIAPHDLRHVFERFFQAARPDGGRVQGAGLGLSIVRNLVDAHRGEVTVESVVGRGTTFRVTLPARAVTPVAAQAMTG